MKMIFKKYLARLAAVLLVCAGSALASDQLNQVPVFHGYVEEDTEIELDGNYIVIYSLGGNTDVAWEEGKKLQGKTCIVMSAASAALQILLPYCKERFYFPDKGSIQFHSTHLVYVGTCALNVYDAVEAVTSLTKSNTRMISHMLESGFPLSETWLHKALREEYLFKGKGLEHLHPWLRPVTECFHCPTWLQMLR